MDFGRSNPNPNQLPTPPETDTDFLAGSHHATDLTNAPGVADSDVNSHPSASAPFRRVSTLAYHNSPFRLGEPRERTTTRQSRWLIVAIPPAWLVQEHGPIGHTLASGPPQRLAQGVLMPLLPTMYGQLTAIAREFNFPSPVGLCMYLHIVEQGFTMTPRVSDETWPTLWGHLFEARSPSTQQSPVCGRIEFDIERRKARWLDSWLTSTRRHAVDVPVSVPSSLSHWRGESKTSFDEKADEHSEALPGAHTRGWSRHIPKKLSLVDKFDTLSVTSSVANAITRNGVANELANSLTTIFQEDEPKTVKKALEQRVQSWRASSSVAPTPIAMTGQVGFDIPNKAQVGDVEVLTEVEDVEPLDLNDFAWSVSSIGPQDHEPLASAFSSPRVSSVHLDRRIEGSVLLTPSTATSWGPKSLDYSPVSTLFRLPSPDIGRRMTEDCPPTPSTVTSWGPEELLYSPASPTSRLPSPDLGRRMLEDCPPTPSTATSWGPGELLFSPASMVVRLPSPDLGLRALDDPSSPFSARITWGPPAKDDDFSRTSSILTGNHVFPYFMASDRPAWTLIWPFYEKNAASYAHSTYVTSVENNGLNSTPGVLTGNYVSPYFTASDRPAWTLIWPFYEKNAAFCDSTCITPVENNGFNSTPGVLTGNYVFPYFTPSDRPAWTLTWPFYGTETVPSAFSSRLPKLYPTIEICRYSKHLRVIIVKRATDDVVYPHFELFPGHICVAQEATAGLSPRNSTEHTGDSSLDMHNGRLNVVRPSVKVSSVYLENGYPTLSIYPPVYPYLCIYPSRHADSVVAQDVEPHLSQNPFSHLELGTQYPSFNLYPASYPNNLMCIYPPAMPGPTSFLPFSDADRPPYSSAVSSHPKTISSCNKVDQTVDEEVKGINIRLPEVYPRIPLYTTVYPEFELYPSVSLDETNGPMTTARLSLYPCMRIYPIVYPCFEIYPGHISTGENNGVDRFGVSSPPPPVLYPHFDLYPGPSEDQSTLPSTKLSPQYPSLNLYLPVSPHSQISPSAVPELGAPNTSRGFISRKARKTHKDLHDEVFVTDALAKEPVQPAIARPQTGTHALGRVRSGTVSAHPGLRQSVSSPSSLPPVPPLPVSTLATRRTTTSNAGARRSGLPVSPVATRNLADRPVSSYTAPPQQPSPIDDEGLLVQSNTLMSANSSQRRDHAHHKQNRPRDSLVLEKARLFEHLHALSNDEPPSSTSSIPGKSARLSSSPVL
ncbi:hypothetical protein EDB92DRAFT_2005970 [Lactarius akahatsu]|uniref:Uncharacterized protein n=1 Tax=Lactarius akahatsu TaxID=416441 RepID=A0AAD4LTI2_9AGAM|nr:hypothetical protein EDB92DRAFT_2005970 [Lactarius akahatsu]